MTRNFKGDGMQFLNPFMARKLSEKEIKSIGKTLFAAVVKLIELFQNYRL